jgi:hypothetical protein
MNESANAGKRMTIWRVASTPIEYPINPGSRKCRRAANATPAINPAVEEIARGKTTRSLTRVGSVLPNSRRQNASSEVIQPPASLFGCESDPETDMNPSFTAENCFAASIIGVTLAANLPGWSSAVRFPGWGEGIAP